VTTRSSFPRRHALVLLGVTLSTGVLLAVGAGRPAPALAAREEIKPFIDVTEALGLKGSNGEVAAWGDFDNDGYVDLVTGGRLFRNPGGSNHWLKVRLEGAGKVNRTAIGAQVRLRLGEATLTRQVEGATGQGNQNDLTLHFGLGEHKGPVRLEVRWPDGSRRDLETPVDRTVTVKRADGAGR
jgi:hypothetical protein